MNPITRDTKREHATRQQQLQLSTPVCPRCENRGYTNCPQARAPGGGDYIAIALRSGTACSCPIGAEFAKNQMIWMEMDDTPATEEIQ